MTDQINTQANQVALPVKQLFGAPDPNEPDLSVLTLVRQIIVRCAFSFRNNLCPNDKTEPSQFVILVTTHLVLVSTLVITDVSLSILLSSFALKPHSSIRKPSQ